MPHQGSSLEKLDVRTVEPIRWTSEGVVMLDQLKLPGEVVYHTYADYREVAQAIKHMVIRGAPAIGIAAAMGVALGVERSEAKTLPELQAEFRNDLRHSRAHAAHRRRSILGNRTVQTPL